MMHKFHGDEEVFVVVEPAVTADKEISELYAISYHNDHPRFSRLDTAYLGDPRIGEGNQCFELPLRYRRVPFRDLLHGANGIPRRTGDADFLPNIAEGAIAEAFDSLPRLILVLPFASGQNLRREPPRLDGFLQCTHVGSSTKATDEDVLVFLKHAFLQFRPLSYGQ